MLSWLKTPHSKYPKQFLHAFQSIVSIYAPGSNVGELGTCAFNQESIRRALMDYFELSSHHVLT